MSKANVETAREASEAIDRRDRTAWLALHQDDCEVVAMDDWPEPGVRGAEAAWNFYGTVFDALDRIGRSGIGDVELVDAGGDKVLAHLRNDLSGGETGAGVQFDYWVVVTLRRRKTFASIGSRTTPTHSKPPGCGSRNAVPNRDLRSPLRRWPRRSLAPSGLAGSSELGPDSG